MDAIEINIEALKRLSVTVQQFSDAMVQFGVAAGEYAAQMTDAFAKSGFIDLYMRNHASAEQLTDFIVNCPNHTWNGLTIRPDEAWRYRENDLWITWRRKEGG